MTLNIPPEKMAEYRAGARQREAARQAALNARFELAWELAQQAADILRSQFQATKVVVFGSLLNRQLFHQRSDIDLAVWDVAEANYLHAFASLSDLTTNFSFDLVRIEEASTRLQQRVQQDGIEL